MTYDDGFGWGMAEGMGWVGWAMMAALCLLGVVLVAVLIWAVLPSTRTAPNLGGLGASAEHPGSRPVAQLILDERFARGDIDQAEYEQRSRALHVR